MNGGKLEGVSSNLYKLLLVIGKAAARTASGEGRAQNNGVTDSLGSFLCFL